MRWRPLKRCRPPRGKQLLIYDPALRGKRDVLDDGTRVGYFDGLRLRAADEAPGEFLHWLPYSPPPKLARPVNGVLTTEMTLLVDRLRAAQRKGDLAPRQPFTAGTFEAKLSTLRALARRGIVQHAVGSSKTFVLNDY